MGSSLCPLLGKPAGWAALLPWTISAADDIVLVDTLVLPTVYSTREGLIVSSGQRGWRARGVCSVLDSRNDQVLFLVGAMTVSHFGVEKRKEPKKHDAFRTHGNLFLRRSRSRRKRQHGEPGAGEATRAAKMAMSATVNRRGGRIKGLFNVSCMSVSVESRSSAHVVHWVRCVQQPVLQCCSVA